MTPSAESESRQPKKASKVSEPVNPAKSSKVPQASKTSAKVPEAPSKSEKFPAKSAPTSKSGAVPKALPPGKSQKNPVISIEAPTSKDEDLAGLDLSHRCGKCGGSIPSSDVSSGAAVKNTEGKWVCKTCYSKKPAAGAGGAAASGKAAGAAAKLCPACDGPLRVGAFSFGGRAYCNSCKPEFERILNEGQTALIGKSLSCASCKKPASGEGAIVVSGLAYCKTCRPSADKQIVFLVRELRKKQTGSGTGIFAFIGAAAVVAAMIGAFLFMRPSTQLGKEAGSGRSDVPVVSPGQKKLDEINKLMGHAPGDFPQGLETYKKVRELADQAKSYPESAACDQKVKEAKEAMQRFAPGEAGKAKAEAAKYEAMPKPNWDKAVEILSGFPEELRDTLSWEEDVSKRLERDQTLAKLYKTGDGLMARLKTLDQNDKDAVEGLARGMRALLSSPEATKVELKTMPFGIQLENECRRLENHLIQDPHPQPADKKSVEDKIKNELASASASEKARDWAKAKAGYLKVLDAYDDGNVEAVLGMARVSVETEQQSEVFRYAGRAQKLARNDPGTILVSAWVDYLHGAEIEVQNKLQSLPKDTLHTRLGNRLSAILDMLIPSGGKPGKEAKPPPKISKHRVRVAVSPNMSSEDAFKVVETLDFVEGASDVLGLTGEVQNYQVFLFPSEKELSDFVAKLQLKESKREADGALPGCFAYAIVGNDAPAFRKLVGNMVAQRAQLDAKDFRGWFAAAVPEIAVTNKATPPSSATVGLKELVKSSASEVQKDAKALETAKAYASLILTADGLRDLMTFVKVYPKDSGKAIKDLEAALKRRG